MMCMADMVILVICRADIMLLVMCRAYMGLYFCYGVAMVFCRVDMILVMCDMVLTHAYMPFYCVHLNIMVCIFVGRLFIFW